MQRKDTIGDRGRPITHAPGHKMHASVGRPNCLRRGELRPASRALALMYLSRQAVVGVGLVHPGEDLGAAEAGELPGMHAGEVRSWSARVWGPGLACHGREMPSGPVNAYDMWRRGGPRTTPSADIADPTRVLAATMACCPAG